jgi:murein DD-endopeptidase MepM/ murein hydrolase activator NlpD
MSWLLAAVPSVVLAIALFSIKADAQRGVATASLTPPAAGATPIQPRSRHTGMAPNPSLASTFAQGQPGALTVPDAAVAEQSIPWTELRVRSGDTIGDVFDRHGLKESTWREIINLGGDSTNLARIRAGDIIRVRIGKNGQLLELAHQIDLSRTLHVRRVGSKLQSEVMHSRIERRVNYVADTIEESDGSLFLSAQKVGLSDRVTMQMFEVFRWDVDFALDIHPGDRYSIVYEEIYRDGEKLRDGNILAAEFTNNGRTLRAVRYADKAGNSEYYTPTGAPLHKAFIRTPVAYTRISSRFGFRRHPVLNRIRSHKGVDYAAPMGTSIKSTGSGRVAFRGRQGGYGNVVIIQHANRIQTLYGHMSRFASGIKVGSRVKQGQVIGYVGRTGLATGPHLHYEFRVNGRHMNPLTVKLPNAAPLSPQYRTEFLKSTAPLLTQLDHLRHLQVARVEE